MEAFKALDEIALYTRVYNAPDKSTLVCEGNANHCRIRMRWTHTPMIYGVVPAVLYHGQLAGIRIDPREAPASKKAGELPVTVRLDGFLMDHEGFLDTDTNLGKWNTQLVQGIV
jgi:hypothetical protein